MLHLAAARLRQEGAGTVGLSGERDVLRVVAEDAVDVEAAGAAPQLAGAAAGLGGERGGLRVVAEDAVDVEAAGADPQLAGEPAGRGVRAADHRVEPVRTEIRDGPRTLHLAVHAHAPPPPRA